MAGGFGWEVREGEAEMIGLMSPCDPKNLQHRGICSLIGYWKGESNLVLSIEKKLKHTSWS